MERHAMKTNLISARVHLVLACALGLPATAWAQQTNAPFDSPVPLTTPVPTAGLILAVEGGTVAARNVSKKPLFISTDNQKSILGQTSDPTYGPFLRFSETIDTRLKYVVQDHAPFGTTTKLTAAPGATDFGKGLTLAVWFRYNSANTLGLIPIFKKGFCVSTLNGNPAVHDCGSMPTGQRVASDITISDTLWHHLALRISTHSVDLFVDGQAAVSFVNPKPLSWLQSDAMRETRFGTQPAYIDASDTDKTKLIARKSPTDIAKIYLYNLPLNLADIQAIRASFLAGLAFQWPPLDSYLLGFTPVAGSARPRNPNGTKNSFEVSLPVKALAASTGKVVPDLDLLRYQPAGQQTPLYFKETAGSEYVPPSILGDVLKDLTSFSIGAWIRWPDTLDATGKAVLTWRPTYEEGTGWTIQLASTAASKAQLKFVCGNGTSQTFEIGRTDATSPMSDMTNRWHLLAVRPIDDANVEVHLNQVLLGKVGGCTGYNAPVLVAGPFPYLAAAGDVPTSYVAVFRGRTPLSTLAQYLAPGPQLYSAVAKTTDVTDDWGSAASVDYPAGGAFADGYFGSRTRFWLNGADLRSWLFLDEANPAFTFSTKLVVNGLPVFTSSDFLSGAKWTTVLASRTFTKSLPPPASALTVSNTDVQILFDDYNEQKKFVTLAVETPSFDPPSAPSPSELSDNPNLSHRRRFLVPVPLTVGTEYRITVAWPYIHPDFSKPDTSETILEPAVFINGELINATKNLPLDKQTGVVPSSNRSWATQLAAWKVADPSNNPRLRFTLSDTRVYPRAVLEGATLGIACASLPASLSCQSNNLAANVVPAQSLVSATCTCSSCDTSKSYRVASVGLSGEECREKLDLFDACAVNEQCKSGVCQRDTDGAGFCVYGPSDQAKCEADCNYRGRQCIAQGAGGWTCGDCRPGFVLEAAKQNFAVTSPDRDCAYRPTKKYGETCEFDAECLSNKCKETVLRTTTRLTGGQIVEYMDQGQDYSGCCSPKTIVCKFPGHKYENNQFGTNRYEQQDVIAKVCMASSKEQCEQLSVPAGPPIPVIPPVVQPALDKGPKAAAALAAYECQFKGSHACLAGEARRARILKPEACEKMLTAKGPPGKEHQGWVHEAGECKAKCGGILGLQCKTTRTSKAEYSKRRLILERTGLDLTVADLKFLFLNDESTYQQSDYGKLLDAGVGNLLFEYAVADATGKAELVKQYGAFQPIGACDGSLASFWKVDQDKLAYWTNNDIACEPDAQDNGAVCKPPPHSKAKDAATDSRPWQEVARKYCKSYYCNRVSLKCDDGDNPLDEVRLSKEGMNIHRQGKQNTVFGYLRMDYAQIKYNAKTCANNQHVDPVTGNCSATATPEAPSRFGELAYKLAHKYTLFLFYIPIPAFGVENNVSIDKVGPEPIGIKDRCTTGNGKLTILGYDYDAAPPPDGGTCNLPGKSLPAGGWHVCGTDCPKEPEDPFGDFLKSIKPTKPTFNPKKQGLAAKAKFKGIDPGPGASQADSAATAVCLPIEMILGKKIKKKLEKVKQFNVGPVPAYVAGKIVPLLCVNAEYEWWPDGFPALRIEPWVAVEVQGKIAVGFNSKGVAEAPDTPATAPGKGDAAGDDKDGKKKKEEEDKVEVGIGVRLTVLLLRIGFPVVEGAVVRPLKDALGKVVKYIYELGVYEKVLFNLATLGGGMELWGGLAIGPWKLEIIIPLFSWAPLRWEWEISSSENFRRVIDFLAKFPHPGGQVPQLPTCNNWNPWDTCNAPIPPIKP